MPDGLEDAFSPGLPVPGPGIVCRRPGRDLAYQDCQRANANAHLERGREHSRGDSDSDARSRDLDGRATQHWRDAHVVGLAHGDAQANLHTFSHQYAHAVAYLHPLGHTNGNADAIADGNQATGSGELLAQPIL